jgi:hypothetical protein
LTEDSREWAVSIKQNKTLGFYLSCALLLTPNCLLSIQQVGSIQKVMMLIYSRSSYGSPIKKKGLKTAQEFPEAKDRVCRGDRSTRLDYHCLASYDHSLPRTLSWKIGSDLRLVRCIRRFMLGTGSQKRPVTPAFRVIRPNRGRF